MHEKTTKRQDYGPFARWLGRTGLRLLGWRCEGARPPMDKSVILAVPHTTNWDLLFMLLVTMTLGAPVVFMMKDTVFWWPLGLLWRWMGGIPINRKAATSVVQQAVDAFGDSEVLYMAIAPEGTRKEVKYWKLGFYRIAHGAGVPITFGYLDYKHKIGGLGPTIETTGNVEEDFARIHDFYQEKIGIRPEINVGKAEPPPTIKNAAGA